MANFVLVHGGMHGGWCWEKIVPRLQAAGHRVTAPDLPAMAVNDEIAAKDVTLAMIGDFLANHVRAQDEPVVLVGHSMGGVAISEAAERVPDSLAGLVYLSAMLVPAGMTMFEKMKEREPHVAFAIVSDDGTELRCSREDASRHFYNTSDAHDIERALERLVPQPMKPGLETVTVTNERFGRVRRAYIECLQDQALSIDFQRQMQRTLPCAPVFTIDTDHSPFLNAPDELTALLIAAASAFLQSSTTAVSDQN
jgi:pimeloyl-ACP methyl ester carboxylesterase